MLKAPKLVFSKIFLFGILTALIGASQAQELQIQFPQEGQQVRGEITVRYTGVPDGGNVNVKLDGNWIMSNAQGSFPLNTFDLKSLSPALPNEGTHKLTLTSINSGGKRTDEKTVSFEVANTRVDTGGEGVLLTHYEDWMRSDPNVQRYRIFAESNGVVDSGQGGGGGGGGEGGGGEGQEWLDAKLDWQVSALMRRVVRDVGGWSDTKLTPDKSDDTTSANIRTVVQEAFQRQRESESGSGGEGGEGGMGAGGGGGYVSKKKKKGPSGPTKAPWKKDWELAPEIGQYFVKNIEPSGKEINATRKAPTIALADLLPTFPDTEVRPGSTWETRMTFLGDLSSREPVNVSVPITFTAFENIQTPAGFNRRAAKLESRFQMPELVAKKMAINLILQGGVGGGGGGEGGASGGGEAGAGGEVGGMTGSTGAKTAATMSADELQDMLDAIPSISSRASRVLWFDMQNHRVLRSEDTIRTFFSYEGSSGESEGGGAAGGGAAMGGGMGGAGGGESSQPAEPTKVSYTLVVTTWYDDTVPSVHPKYVSGAGTAHSRDNVKDPSIEKISKPVAP